MAEDDTASLTDREKWKVERSFKERELALKEREQIVREKDLEARQTEMARSRWRSPLVVAVLAAAVAAAGNGLVALLNGQENRRLEEARAEAARILEMIKTGDPDKAATNLRFLADAGLIANQAQLAAVRQYLDQRTPGQGTSLPPPSVPLQPTRTLPPADPLLPMTRAVGQLRARDQRYVCTAFRVAPDLIVTAQHCADRGQGQSADLIFSPLEPDGSASPAGIPVFMPAVEVIAFPDREPSPNVVVLRLQTTERAAATWLAFSNTPPAAGTPLAAIAFFGTPEQVVARGQDCAVVEVRDEQFSHRCELGAGSSGAPLLSPQTSGVVGINFAAGPDRRWAVRADQILARSEILRRRAPVP